jgi:hypothetical protein
MQDGVIMRRKSSKTIVLPVILFFFALLPALPAQTLARDMDAILESDAVTWAQAARFVLPSAGFPDAAGLASFQTAQDRGWLPKDAQAEGEATFGGLSFLVMKAFDIPGGLMYRLFPGPRYAYRELQYQGVIQGQQDSARKVSGFWLISLIGRTLDLTGEEE